VSFPPLQPVLIAVWNTIAHSGVYAGAWINVIVALLTFPLLLALSRRLAASDAPGIFAAAALAGSPWYLDEVMSGRSIPLAILLFTLLLLLLHRLFTTDAWSPRTAAAAGVVAGLIFEARFDFLLPAIAIGAALPGKTRGRLSATGAYFLGLAAAVSPWVVYSMARFGVPLASNHTRTAMAVESLNLMRFVPFPESIATFRNAPFEWIASKVYGSWRMVEAVAVAIGASPIPALAGMWAATRTDAPGPPRETTITLALAWLALGVHFALTSTTGYPDVRYWIAASAFGTFTLAVAMFSGREGPQAGPAAFLLFVPAQIALLAAAGHEPDRVAGIFSCLWPMAVIAFFIAEPHMRASRGLARLGKGAAIAVPILALAIGSLLAVRATGSRYRFSADATARTLASNTRILEGLDGADPARTRILLATLAGAPLICEFGARTGVANVLKPTPPFGWVDLWLLVHRYGITHAIAGDPEIDARLPMLFTVRKSANGALWKIEGDRPGLVLVDEAHPAESIPGLNSMLLITNAGGPIDASRRPPSRAPDEWSYPLVFVPRN
jgi:hypothetical protein